MSRLLELYNKKKCEDSSKVYMFKGGVFYYFLSDDAKYIGDKYGLKLTSFGNDVKCGFPVKSLEKYLYIISNENIELINDEKIDKDKIINKIKNVDMNDISPRDAYIILNELSELVK